MSLIVKNNNFVIEDIVDEDGKKIGELKFNPSDSRIMNRLVKIVEKCEKGLKKLKSIGEFEDISNLEINSLEDAEKISNTISKMGEALDTEEETIDFALNELCDIFGKDTIELFTEGTKDIDLVMPIVDFVMPYVNEARKKITDKYNIKRSSDVMR